MVGPVPIEAVKRRWQVKAMQGKVSERPRKCRERSVKGSEMRWKINERQ